LIDGFHIHIQNTTKPLSITSDGVGRGLRRGDGEGKLTNVQSKPIWNCDNESCPVQWIHANKKGRNKIYVTVFRKKLEH
jgi:hypothetical protein